MQYLKQLLIPFAACFIAFTIGMWAQRQIYIDLCQNMGGAINSAGNPICIKEIIITQHEIPTDTMIVK